MIHLDTHVAAWLYAGARDQFPTAVVDLIEREDLVISPMVELELQYLHEIGRLTVTGRSVVADLETRIGLRRSPAPFPMIVDRAATVAWTRDPFDRLIVANAHVDGARLLTRDEAIRAHESIAVWDGATTRRGRRKKPR